VDLNTIQITATIVSITVGGISILGFLIGVWTKLQKVMHSLDSFMLDWTGSEERPGRDAVPGVMERLNKIDGELKHNGGSTMKDALKRIEAKVDRLDERIEKGDKRFIEGENRFNELESRIEEIADGKYNG
jgi:peptidoglycan hydrolase CwlO-like protein